MAADIKPAASGSSLTQTKELLAAGSALSDPKEHEGYAPYVIVPDGYKVEPLTRESFTPLPDHIRQRVRLDDAASFIAYVKAFKLHLTRIFGAAVNLAKLAPGCAGGARFTALLDYHEGGKDQKAQRVQHVAEYPVPLSLEFSAWLAQNGKAQQQLDFVSFIEANGIDVVNPDSASLMELALNFEAKANVQFQTKIDRTTGGKVLNYSEQIEAGAPAVGQIKVPDGLSISVPVFEGGKKYSLSARLEFRPSGGRLTIAYHLQRPHEALRAAMKDLREEIAGALEIEILTGEAQAPTE